MLFIQEANDDVDGSERFHGVGPGYGEFSGTFMVNRDVVNLPPNQRPAQPFLTHHVGARGGGERAAAPWSEDRSERTRRCNPRASEPHQRRQEIPTARSALAAKLPGNS